MFDSTITFDADYMVFAAPKPALLTKTLAMIYPFQLNVWVPVVVSLIVFSFSFYVIARIEGAILSWQFNGLSIPKMSGGLLP